MTASPSNPNTHVNQATTASLLSGVGRSAIAVISVMGPDAEQVVQRCFDAATHGGFRAGQIRYGNWHGGDSDGESRHFDSTNSTSESIVVVPVDDGELEIHCHGGVAATGKILEDLGRHNVRVIAWQDPLSQPAESQLIRESIEVLSRCMTARTAAIAMDQVRGALLDWCQNALDNDLPFDEVRRSGQGILAFAPFGLRVTDRFRVVLAGPPNVGKSSLINAMVGYDRSIALDQPGTTRDVLHAETVMEGLAIQLSDTAGIRSGQGEIEKEGIRRANLAVREADLVIWVTTPDSNGDCLQSRDESKSSIQVLNKADLLSSPLIDESFLPTVATTGQGVTELMAAVVQALVPDFPSPGTAVPITRRQQQALAKIVAASDQASQRNAVAELLG
ncbi:MAG: GTPase, partial [Pirellulaceae bacterium]